MSARRYCSVERCKEHHYAKGLCEGHYKQQRKTGSPGELRPKRKRTRGLWAARCVMCDHIVCEGRPTSLDAQTMMDAHLVLIHGIEVES